MKKNRKIHTSKDTAVTILTSGCHFSGKLYCRGSSRIGGRIEGEVVSEGLLIIEQEALITANVSADEVIVQGRVNGTMTAKGRIELTATAKFEGDITTSNLVVNDGAQFNGRCHMAIDEASNENSPRIGESDVTVLKVPEVNVTQ